MNRREIIEQDRARFESAVEDAFKSFQGHERTRLLIHLNTLILCYGEACMQREEKRSKYYEKKIRDCMETLNGGSNPSCDGIGRVEIACFDNDIATVDVFHKDINDDDEEENMANYTTLAAESDIQEFLDSRGINIFGTQRYDLAKRFTECLLEQPDPTPKAIEDGTDPIFCLVDVPEPWVEHLEYDTPIEEPMDGELEAFEEFKSEFTYVDVARDKEPYFGTLEQMPWLKGTIQPCICKRKEKE